MAVLGRNIMACIDIQKLENNLLGYGDGREVRWDNDHCWRCRESMDASKSDQRSS
jgi:hypothetical protein